MAEHREFWKTRRIKNQPLRTFAGAIRFARITEVYDGDTITVQTRLSRREPYYQYKVRLEGIDTPEKRHADPAHREAGLAVAALVAQRLMGRTVRMRFIKEDKYGRLCGTVFVGRMGWWSWKDRYNFNAWLVREGLAHPYSGKVAKKPFGTEELQDIAHRADVLRGS